LNHAEPIIESQASFGPPFPSDGVQFSRLNQLIDAGLAGRALSLLPLLVAADTAGQTKDGGLQRREHRTLHLTIVVVVPFQHVTEAVPVEVDFVDDSATAAVIIKNFSLTAGGVFLLMVLLNAVSVPGGRRPMQLALYGRVESDLV
jgi:hypothetical protein